ncbi:hypothetical protein EON65_37620 [archaeon]|nr:MAG: hypothetical protein EON65_37620 [archaeon]
MNVTELHIRMLLRLIQHLGTRLEILRIPSCIDLPASLIEAMVQHCPNIDSIFYGSVFGMDVTADMYFHACTCLKKFKDVALLRNCGFILTDAKLLEYLPRHTELQMFSVFGQPLTLRSLQTMVESCPSLKLLQICTIACNFNLTGNKRTTRLTLNNCKDSSLLSDGAFLSFLAALPRIVSVVLPEICDDFNFHLALSGCFIQSGACTRVESLQVGKLTSFNAILPTFEAFPLLDILIICFDCVEFSANFTQFIQQVATSCFSLSLLEVGRCKHLKDCHLLELVQGLPKLTYLKGWYTKSPFRADLVQLGADQSAMAGNCFGRTFTIRTDVVTGLE